LAQVADHPVVVAAIGRLSVTVALVGLPLV